MRCEWRSRTWRTIRRVILRISGKKEKKKTACRGRSRGFEKAASFHEALAADTNGAEAEDDVAAGSGPAEAHHRAKAGEKKHLVELMAQIRAVRTSENLVTGHLAVVVDGYVDEKTMRKGKLYFVLLRRPSLRIVQIGRASCRERV